jgi:hypothetical protein
LPVLSDAKAIWLLPPIVGVCVTDVGIIFIGVIVTGSGTTKGKLVPVGTCVASIVGEAFDIGVSVAGTGVDVDVISMTTGGEVWTYEGRFAQGTKNEPNTSSEINTAETSRTFDLDL